MTCSRLRFRFLSLAITALFLAVIPQSDSSRANRMAFAGSSVLPTPVEGAERANAMHELFKRRHSVRSFLDRKVSHEALRAILEAANSAPSAGGLKAREIIIAEDKETKRKLVAAALGQDFIAQAPVVLVFWAVPSRSAWKYGARGRELYCVQDATIAASFAWIQAVALDLAGCWVGAFDEEAVKHVFRKDIKEDWRPIALLPIGYAAE